MCILVSLLSAKLVYWIFEKYVRYLAHYSAVISGSQVALADMSLHAVATDASGIMIVFFDENDNLDYRAFILSDDDLTSVGFYGPAGAGYKGPLLYDIPLGRSPLVRYS